VEGSDDSVCLVKSWLDNLAVILDCTPDISMLCAL